MAKSTTLYTWATPAFLDGSPVDHTWVTTFDNQADNYTTISDVIAAAKDYWFCWGGYHPRGGAPTDASGKLGEQSGDLNLARCLVSSNADSRNAPAARGCIFVYGVDGVCHQLANQVLYATGGSGSPLPVSNARGYFASAFIYGTYGLQYAAWANRIQACAGARIVSTQRGGVAIMANLKDDFVERASSVLGSHEPELLAKLLALKGQVHAFAAQRVPGAAPPNAETLNARNQHLLEQAAILLGPEKFESIFGFPAGTTISLVDPTVASPTELRNTR